MALSFEKLADIVWQNAVQLEFGSGANWAEGNIFREEWVRAIADPVEWDNQPGLYWFLTAVSLNDLACLDIPSDIKKKACKIPDVVKENIALFGTELLSNADADGLTVVYNGHHALVFSRLGEHFWLKNDSTGAIGLRAYENTWAKGKLSKERWCARYFHTGMVEGLKGLTAEEKDRLRTILGSKRGRISIEFAWRRKYGWPAFCKEGDVSDALYQQVHGRPKPKTKRGAKVKVSQDSPS